MARAALWSLAYIGSALSNGPRSGLRDIAHLPRDPALRIAIEMLSSCPMKVLHPSYCARIFAVTQPPKERCTLTDPSSIAEAH